MSGGWSKLTENDTEHSSLARTIRPGRATHSPRLMLNVAMLQTIRPRRCIATLSKVMTGVAGRGRVIDATALSSDSPAERNHPHTPAR